MNKKFKIIFVTVIILLLTTVVTFAIIRFLNKDEPNDKEPNIPNNSNNEPNNQDSKIHLFGKELNSLEELNEQDVKDYLNQVRIVLKEKTYTAFNDEEITLIVAYELLMYESASAEEIEKFVEGFFGKKGFQVKEGKYISSIDDEIIISKSGDEFISNLGGKGVTPPYNIYKSMEIKNDRVIVHYDYGTTAWRTGEIISLEGNTDIYLKYANGNLILEKIIYTKK